MLARQILQAERAADLVHILRVGQIVFVGKNQHWHRCVLAISQRPHQLDASLLEALLIDRVHHKDNAVGASSVRAPQRPNLVLATNIPDCERYALDEIKISIREKVIIRKTQTLLFAKSNRTRSQLNPIVGSVLMYWPNLRR